MLLVGEYDCRLGQLVPGDDFFSSNVRVIPLLQILLCR